MPSEPSATTGAPQPGTIIDDKYRVVDALGSGGMGCLVRAEHLLLKKSVAIKFVQSDRSSATRGRLFREARAAQALSSDHVVRVFDLGVHQDAPYIVMELLEGTDLSAHVQTRGPLPVSEAVDCIVEASVAVAEAHAAGIIHRDIKPANLFLTRTARQQLVKVLDFGISKIVDPSEEDCEKTAEDTVLGTPYYCSPEQLRNPSKIDGRTDVWALAVTLFHLLTGEHPFPGSTARAVTAAIFTDSARDARELRAEVPEALCGVLARALAKRPDERTPSVARLVHELLPFASRRGRIAADRVLAMEEAQPLPREANAAPRATAPPLSTTGEGLASTLRPGADRQTTAPRVAELPMHRPRALWIAAASSAALAFVWLVQAGPAPLRLMRAAPPSLPTARAAAPPPPAPVAPASAPRAVPPPPPAKRLLPHIKPAPSASALPEPATSGRRDIDGVPIVD